MKPHRRFSQKIFHPKADPPIFLLKNKQGTSFLLRKGLSIFIWLSHIGSTFGSDVSLTITDDFR
jgi:hypothetical protein